MRLGENERFSECGAGDPDERARSAGTSSSLLTGFLALSVSIKAMDDESCLFSVAHSLFLHCWVYSLPSFVLVFPHVEYWSPVYFYFVT